MDLIHFLQLHNSLHRVSNIIFPIFALPTPVISCENLADAKYIIKTNNKINNSTIIMSLINIILSLECVIFLTLLPLIKITICFFIKFYLKNLYIIIINRIIIINMKLLYININIFPTLGILN